MNWWLLVRFFFFSPHIQPFPNCALHEFIQYLYQGWRAPRHNNLITVEASPSVGSLSTEWHVSNPGIYSYLNTHCLPGPSGSWAKPPYAFPHAKFYHSSNTNPRRLSMGSYMLIYFMTCGAILKLISTPVLWCCLFFLLHFIDYKTFEKEESRK